ncbi:MAG: hypothetical protein WAU81_13455 [Candidatus Aminicenantales bacterium]
MSLRKENLAAASSGKGRTLSSFWNLISSKCLETRERFISSQERLSVFSLKKKG